MTNNILTKSIAISGVISMIAISIVSFSSSIVSAQSADGAGAGEANAANPAVYENLRTKGISISMKYTSKRVNPGQDITFEWSILNRTLGDIDTVQILMGKQDHAELYPEYLQYVPNSAQVEILDPGQTSGSPTAFPSALEQKFSNSEVIQVAKVIPVGVQYKVRWRMTVPSSAERGVWVRPFVAVGFNALGGDNGSQRVRLTDTRYVDVLVLPDTSNQLGISMEHLVDNPRDPVNAGDTITYRVKLMNEGGVQITNTDLVLVVPNGHDNQLVEYVPGSASWSTPIGDGQMYEEAIPDDDIRKVINDPRGKYRIEALNPRGNQGDTIYITYSVRVKSGVVAGTILQNIAQAYSFDNQICDTQAELNNECTVWTNTVVDLGEPAQTGIGLPPVPGSLPAGSLGPGAGAGGIAIGTGIGAGAGIAIGSGVGDTGIIRHPDFGLPVGALLGWIGAVTALGGSAFFVGRRMMK